MEEESKYGRFNEDGFFEFSKNSKSKKYIQDNVSPTSDDEEDNIQDPWFESLKDPLHNNEQVISSHIKISEHAVSNVTRIYFFSVWKKTLRMCGVLN
jgi:hypothetical protein